MGWLHNRNTHAILRIIEVIAVVIGTLGIGIITVAILITDSQTRKQQTAFIDEFKTQQRILQDEMDRVISSKADAGIIVGLLTEFCSREAFNHVFADLLTDPNSLDRNTISQIIFRNCTDGFKTSPQQLAAEDEYNTSAARFVRKVMSGREFYGDRLWAKAAELWNEAAGSIPPFLAKGTIDEDKLAPAKLAYAQKQFEVSSDLFKAAFQKVGSNSK